MTSDEYEAYLPSVLPRYASEGAKAFGAPMDEALAFAPLERGRASSSVVHGRRYYPS